MRRVRRANLLLHLGDLVVDALQAEAEGAATGGRHPRAADAKSERWIPAGASTVWEHQYSSLQDAEGLVVGKSLP